MRHPIDTLALKRDHPIVDVIIGYGIELHQRGRVLVGRCPFHNDGGRPNLYVYPASDSFYCYRCAVGGDVIRFVERIEQIGFRAAVTRLMRPGSLRTPQWHRPSGKRPPRRARSGSRDPAERACLAAAVELYQNRLLTDARALAYVERRGLTRGTLERYRVGYAAGDELAAYLGWRRLPLGAARRVGLLGAEGRERFAGRVVVPEIRAGQPIWLIGRTIDPGEAGPTYLGLPGRKPLLGWEGARRHQSVCLVEGVFDWLTLQQWNIPGLALGGSHVRPAVLRALTRFARLYVLLDTDAAGRAATTALRHALGDRIRPVTVPGAKDVAELAEQPGGRACLLAALRTAAADVS